MICPVFVANEMSGLKGRVGVRSQPHWRLKGDAAISGPSFGTGNEDQGSDHTSDEWTNQLDASQVQTLINDPGYFPVLLYLGTTACNLYPGGFAVSGLDDRPIADFAARRNMELCTQDAQAESKPETSAACDVQRWKAEPFCNQAAARNGLPLDARSDAR